jgi:hypothetical protein
MNTLSCYARKNEKTGFGKAISVVSFSMVSFYPLLQHPRTGPLELKTFEVRFFLVPPIE